MQRGRYIAFEGAEASGKSTHAARLADAIGAVLTRETGGTDIGRRIREILHDTGNTHLSHRSEALLAAADRAQHLHELVGPALDGGRHVVSDRTVYSTLAYQGYGRGLDLDEIRRINDWAIEGRWPELVILLDVPEELVASRMRTRQLDRFEQEDPGFHRRVRDGFRAMAAAEPDRWVVVDGTPDKDTVARTIRTVIADRLGL
ncbi:MAG: dTMP kinase [Ilumatobacteraceae bacterium]